MNNKRGFTLVELIVVITILSILGTIGFLSFQNYGVFSRDVVRKSDLSSMKSVLEYYYLENDIYPEPDDSTSVTYSGGVVRNEGTFGDNVFKNIRKLSNIPRDPLTDGLYTYSVTSAGNEYELGAIFEGDNVSINKNFNNIYAESNNLKSFVTGNYNGLFVIAHTGGVDYVLASPSIIHTKVGSNDLLYILKNKKLSFKGFYNLPSSYKLDYFPKDELDEKFVNFDGILIFSGSIDKLKEDSLERKKMVLNLQKAYSGTLLKNKDNIKKIISIDSDSEYIEKF